ncbi:MAG: LysR family transcriptional regulator [Pseudomonadales bacterium]|nr:LysR family transcriptional regulator [Pseudomonadales bacterium]
MNELDDMALFAAVVQAQSFTKAAENIDVPLSTISRRLANLEQRLGVKLMERTTRRLQLTESGRIYFDYCERVVNQAAEAKLALQNLREEPEGHLIFAATVGSDDSWGSELLSGFLQKYPKITLEAKVLSMDADFDAEEYDICFAHGQRPITRHQLLSLGTSSLKFCASHQYLSRRGMPIQVEDLLHHDMINCEPFAWDRYRPAGCESIQLPMRIKTSELLIARKSAVDGLGIAYLPDITLNEQLKTGEIQLILPEIQYEMPAWILLPRDKKIARKLEVFFQYFMTAAKQSAPWNFTTD